MKSKWIGLLLSIAVLGWVARPAWAKGTTKAPPLPPKITKPSKDTEEGAPKTEFKDIPTLPDGPGKSYYAIVQTKLYDALFVASNLSVLLYPKENGERIDKPVILDNRFAYTPERSDPKDLLIFSGVRNLAPPSTNLTKLVITAVADGGTVLVQTWKFAEGKIEVEDHLKGYTGDPPTMRTYVKFPQTHKFTPNIEKADREKQMAGYQYTIRGGKAENAMKTQKYSYSTKIENLTVGDSVENQGPWGSRKITIKRKAGKGFVSLSFNGTKQPYDGLEFSYSTHTDPKTKKLDLQGFELKIE